LLLKCESVLSVTKNQPDAPLNTTPPHAVSELMLIGLVTLFLTVATVWIVWYVVKADNPDEVRHLQFFLTFIVAVIPFVILVYFGSAVIIYDAITAPPWPTALPLVPSRPWLWLRWRKL
jgi:hypothetical protein